MIEPGFNPLRFRSRWFCYLDLLGFKARVDRNSIEDLMPLYQQVLRELEMQAGVRKKDGVQYSWFSDTFIVYTKDDSEREFAYLESISMLFFQKLILHGVPLRGAITHGGLYSQSRRNIFVGPALIDAYCYAENQNWIGLILTPAVHSRLKETQIALEARAHYRLVTEPEVILQHPSTPVYAFAFNNGSVNGRNPYIGALEKLRSAAPDRAKEKYDRTLRFIRKHSVQR